MLGLQFKTTEIIVVTTGTIINFSFLWVSAFYWSATRSRGQGFGFQSLTIGRWGCRSICWGCWSRGWCLGWGWGLIIIGCSEDIHAACGTRLLPLKPGAQAAVRKTGRMKWIKVVFFFPKSSADNLITTSTGQVVNDLIIFGQEGD